MHQPRVRACGPRYQAPANVPQSTKPGTDWTVTFSRIRIRRCRHSQQSKKENFVIRQTGLSLALCLVIAASAHSAESPGLAALTGKDTPLKQGVAIAFFGDSITMQGGYIETMKKALITSPPTKDLKVKLLQHGLNGGRVPTVLEGRSPWGTIGGTMQELLDKEKPNVVVIFLGVNDVWHKEKGTSPEDFQADWGRWSPCARAEGRRSC